mmetsp:Transcript_62068/g.135658  ORF Transcript_62068/g.135658 Transcript_62068/m.135658 type:complete len:87 (+) Transcript_62068:60-320(+)
MKREKTSPPSASHCLGEREGWTAGEREGGRDKDEDDEDANYVCVGAVVLSRPRSTCEALSAAEPPERSSTESGRTIRRRGGGGGEG